jgi:PAS domain S-box-containing protein
MIDAVCLEYKHGVFLYVSHAFALIFGYPSELVVGQHMLNFVYEKDKAMTAVHCLYTNSKQCCKPAI